MNLICVVVLCASTGAANAGWLKDIVSPRGLDLGNGLTVKVEDLKKNVSFLERQALTLDYAGYGVSVAKAPGKDAVELGVFVNGQDEEGRGRKKGMPMAMLLGYKMATLVTLTLAIMAFLTIKALFVAKFALFTSAALVIHKLFHHEGHHHHMHHSPAYVEMVDHAPEPHGMEYTASGGGYHPSGSANYFAYSNYVPSAMAENSLNYVPVEASAGNTSVAASQQVAAVARRRDLSRRKTKTAPIPAAQITVHRYSVET